jgi:hypothetical protein
MKFRKTTNCLALAFFLCTSAAHAQLKLPFTNNELRTNLEKVVTDFPKEMRNIRGEVLMENPQTVEYATNLTFEGAEQNTITQYISKKPIFSWQALVLTTEEFSDAAKKYKWLCNQLKVMTLKLDGGYSFTLSGNYEAPDESKKFCTSVFQLTPAAVGVPKLKIEAALQFDFPEWKVNLTVYQKEREDHERGNVREN